MAKAASKFSGNKPDLRTCTAWSVSYLEKPCSLSDRTASVSCAEAIKTITTTLMPELGVNIDHVATLRQARLTYEPDPVWAAALAELGGADSITIHLREDRRHIQDRDLELLRQTVTVKLNLELACDSQVLEIACRVKPDQATLVPERREEITTEGGLDVASNRESARQAVARLKAAGIVVSLFVDPDDGQIEASRDLGADAIELHTGAYALARHGTEQERGLITLVEASARVRRLGMACMPAMV